MRSDEATANAVCHRCTAADNWNDLMEENFLVLDAIAVRVDMEGVLQQLGYPQGARVSAKVREKAAVLITEMRQLILPKGAYLRLEGSPPKGFELFSQAEGIVLAVATIGEAVERRAKELIDKERGATGLIVDAIGTIAVEQTADFLEDRIRRDCAGGGWKVSRRYAPGYCGWKMEAQREIFKHLPDTLGIKLTSSCLMVPEKSLSFVCLLSTGGDFCVVKIGDCRKCRQKDCPYRLEPNEPKDGSAS